MTPASPSCDRLAIAELLQKVFTPTPQGVVGLVEELLEFCRDHQLHLKIQDNSCAVGPAGEAIWDTIAWPLPKSVLRATLARIAALCVQPNAVTPYRGEGEVTLPGNPPTVLQVAFTNTPTEQRLDVRLPAVPTDDTANHEHRSEES